MKQKKNISKKEKVAGIILGLILIGLISAIFYRSWVMFSLMAPLSLYGPQLLSKHRERKRKEDLTIQFKEWLYILSSLLEAGKSLSTAVRESIFELNDNFPAHRANLMKEELLNMIGLLNLNRSVSEALRDTYLRNGIEDMKSFADTIHICEKSGGDVMEVVRFSTGLINETLETRREIELAISQKGFEYKIMSVIPLLFIGILSLTSGEYMQPLFWSMKGVIIMTVSLALILIGFLLSNKIMKINI